MGIATFRGEGGGDGNGIRYRWDKGESEGSKLQQ
jgi:hypothetical protein